MRLVPLLLASLAAPLAAQESKAAAPGPGRIEGIVLDAMGKPVADAEVWLSNQPAPRVRTDAAGAFAFSRLATGYHAPRVKVRGWSRATGRAQVTVDSPLQFTWIKLLPAADVDVRVVDDQGTAIAGAEVFPSRTAAPGHYWAERDERCTTDAAGRVRLEDVALGETAVNVWAPGFAFGSTRTDVGDGREVVVKLTRSEAFRLDLVLAGATPQQIRAARWQLYTVRDGYGAGCNLPPSLVRGGFDAQGTHSIRGLPLDMELRQIGVVLPDAAVAPGSVTLPPATTSKELAKELRFEVVPVQGNEVRGTILGVDGKPIAGLRLTCRSFVASTSLDQEARSDGQGRFTFARVGPEGADFRLTSLDPRWVFDQPKDDAFNTIRYRRQFVGKVQSGTECEIHCVAACEIRGRIVDAAQRGVPGADVRLMTAWEAGRDLSVAWATTDRDGMFVLPRQNGTDAREVWIEGYGRQGDGRSAKFRMAVGAAIQVPDVQVAAAVVVEGVVRDSAGRAVGGASLSLLRAVEAEEADATISDREGRFRLVAGPGSYRLLCHRGHERDRGAAAQAIELRTGETVNLVLVRDRP